MIVDADQAGRGKSCAGQHLLQGPAGSLHEVTQAALQGQYADETLPLKGSLILSVTENGYGKRTPISEYTRHGRGTKGMIAIHTGERNGDLIGAVLVEEKDEVLLVSSGGVVMRTKVAQIREQGRSTQGVTLINLDVGTRLAGVEKVLESEEEGGNGHGNGNGHQGGLDEGEADTGAA